MATKMILLSLAILLWSPQISEQLCLEERVQQLEDLLTKVAQPYISLANNTSGQDFYMDSFNYRDQMALSACTGLSPAGKYIFQVRRDCGKTGIPSSQTCNNICQGVTPPRPANSIPTCYNALHIYYEVGYRQLNPSYGPYPNDDKMTMRMYHYGAGGCSWSPNHCGPNYCCCMGGTV